MGAVRNAIINQINNELKNGVPQAVNALIKNEKGVTEIYNGMMLDWSVLEKPIIEGGLLKFGIKGLFFPKGKGEIEPPVPAVWMPYYRP